MNSTWHQLQTLSLLCTVIAVLCFEFPLVVGNTCADDSNNQVTISPEKNYTVFNNSGFNVTFYCSVTGGTLGWEIRRASCVNNCANLQLNPSNTSHVDGTLGFVVKYRGNSMTESFLTVTEGARDRYGNITVRCSLFPYNGGFPCVSPKNFIYTIGELQDPSNLELLLVNESQHFFTWAKPPVPPGVNITYFIVITNVNLTSGATIVNTSTTETSLAFFNGTSNSYDCNEINMLVYYEVEADDGVWRSRTQNKTENIPISPNITAVSSTLNAAVDLSSGESSLNLGISYLAAKVCSSSYPVTRYFATITDEENRQIEKNYYPTSNKSRINFPLDYAEAQFLALNRVYTLSVTACSNVTCHTSDNVTIYAAYIQNPSIQYSDRNVSLYCELARSSTAKGCQFNFTSNDNTNETFSVLFASNEGTCVNGNCSMRMCAVTNSLLNSYMNITVYAILEDGSVSEFGQPVTPINITNPKDIPDCFIMPQQQSQMVGVTVGIVVGVLALIAILIVTAVILLVVIIHKKPKLKLTSDNKNEYKVELELPSLPGKDSESSTEENVVPPNPGRIPVADGDGDDTGSSNSIPLQPSADSKTSVAADKPKPLRLTIQKRDNNIVLNVNKEVLMALISSSDRTPLLEFEVTSD